MIHHSGVPNDQAALSKLVDSAWDQQARVVVVEPGGVAALSR